MGDRQRSKAWNTVLSGALIATAVGFTTSSCEQKREARFKQGDGTYIYALDDLLSRKATLHTGGVLKEGIANVTIASELVTSTEGGSLIKSQDIVSFSLDDDPIRLSSDNQQYDFFGKPNSTYDVIYKLNEKNLLVYKIVSQEEIASNELTYAQRYDSNHYQVPMFGFPITKYVVEKVEDSRGKPTDRLASIEVKKLADATHVSFSMGDIEYFEPTPKKDTVLADLFDGEDEWYYAKTLVDRPSIPNGSICPKPGICNELGLQEAEGKVIFRKTQSSIVGLDVNVPDGIP